MPLVKTLRKRGVKYTITAYGEVLFAPGAEIPRWTNRLKRRITKATRAEAPTNKRPRWDHYGVTLKKSITSSATVPDAGRMRVDFAVGSTAKHAIYVDQGTGIYGGGGPYLAKILPPYTRGGPSLYEHTWRPGGDGKRVRPVLIKGQRGQHFFEKGLDAGLLSMRLRAGQLPGEGASNISRVLDTAPNLPLGFSGATEANGAFKAQLAEWRAWRDAEWGGRRRLGRDFYDTAGGRRRAERLATRLRRQTSPQRERALSRERSRRYRMREAAKTRNRRRQEEIRDRTPKVSRAEDRKNFLAAMRAKYPRVNPDSLEYSNGRWFVYVEFRDAKGRLVSKRVSAKSKF